MEGREVQHCSERDRMASRHDTMDETAATGIREMALTFDNPAFSRHVAENA